MTGDCHTTVTVTRLPFYQIIQTTGQHPIVNELCRSSKIFEFTKIKNFDQCRSDPLRFSSNPAPDRPPSKHGAALQVASTLFCLTRPVLAFVNKRIIEMIGIEICRLQVCDLRRIVGKGNDCADGRHRPIIVLRAVPFQNGTVFQVNFDEPRADSRHSTVVD